MLNGLESGLIDGHTHLGVDLLFYLRGHSPYAQSWNTLTAQGEAVGIQHFVVFPMVSHLGLHLRSLQKGQISGKGGLDKIPYAFENRRLLQEITRFRASNSARAIPLGMFDPNRHLPAQIESLQLLHEKFSLSGLKTQPTIIQSPILNLITRRGGRLLDLAETHAWPILIHSSVHPQDPWSQVRDILTVVKSRPSLRFCLAHSCRFDRPGLDEIATLPNAWFDCSAHRIHCQLAREDHPSVAPKKTRFPSDYRDPTQVLHDLASAYGPKMIWGTDAPFESYADDSLQLLSSYREEVQVLAGIPAALQRTIAHDNTIAFYGKPPV
ncbi:MAG: amidohydrolase family protein [Verrucomicrobia bacterium]|nr:amidohydrolase family protein [Verrucomicrobiota bacterium]